MATISLSTTQSIPSSLSRALLTLFLTSLTFAKELQNGLRIDVTKAVDCGRPTQPQDHIFVNYNGTLQDGTLFDASHGSPIVFNIGVGEVIRGWDEGLLDMCMGERRTLTIPPELGYGDHPTGPIPAGSTLVFETELVWIAGQPPIDPLHSGGASSSLPSTEAENLAEAEADAAAKEFDQANIHSADTDASPSSQTSKSNGECSLLGPFALVVQSGLGLLALLSLVFKRWRERPRRPLRVWFFDASKQVFGSALLHVFNVFMSIISSASLLASAQHAASKTDNDDWNPNPCSFYLINIAIDTTIGVPILVMILKVLHHAAARTPLANPPESIRSGHYGSPPNAVWWLKQSMIYFIGLLLMKLCVFALLDILPVIIWIGNWALRWTEGNESLQIAFVMFIFPLIANSVQYYIIDTFIKDPSGGEHERVPTEDESEQEEARQPLENDDELPVGSQELGTSADKDAEADAAARSKRLD